MKSIHSAIKSKKKLLQLTFLSDKIMIPMRKTTSQVSILKFITFSVESKYTKEEMDKMNLSALNLFGVPLEENVEEQNVSSK